MAIVAFRTHLWDHHIDLLARQAMRWSQGVEFVVIADETAGPIDCAPFDKLGHTRDFTPMGLPVFPHERTLWHNADFPLYALREKFPGHAAYAMVEYDVFINFNLTALMEKCVAEGIDLMATHIGDAQTDFPWYDSLAGRYAAPKRALIPLMIVSGRAIDFMLEKRREMNVSPPQHMADWPFCEGFIPSCIQELPNAKLFDYGSIIGCPWFWVAEPVHISNPLCQLGNTINHPVMTGPHFIQKCFTPFNVERIFNPEDHAVQALRYYHPREYYAHLRHLVEGGNDPALLERFEQNFPKPAGM
jgi:hypothetical protein